MSVSTFRPIMLQNTPFEAAQTPLDGMMKNRGYKWGYFCDPGI